MSVVENDSFTQCFEVQLLENYVPDENFEEAYIFMVVFFILFCSSYRMNSNCSVNLQNQNLLKNREK